MSLAQVEVVGGERAAIFVSSLRRSIAFYSRVFGFHVLRVVHAANAEFVLVGSRTRVYLEIREWVGAARSRPANGRWSVVVSDLGEVREAIWNLGVVPVAADHTGVVTTGRRSRFITVRDPDGHEIDLVERRAMAVGRRGAMSAAPDRPAPRVPS